MLIQGVGKILSVWDLFRGFEQTNFNIFRHNDGSWYFTHYLSGYWSSAFSNWQGLWWIFHFFVFFLPPIFEFWILWIIFDIKQRPHKNLSHLFDWHLLNKCLFLLFSYLLRSLTALRVFVWTHYILFSDWSLYHFFCTMIYFTF